MAYEQAELGCTGGRTRGIRAFTLIEMLVVLVIIGILAGIVISLAQRVTQGGKYNATKNVIEVAQGLVTEYVTSREATPPQFLRTNRTQMNTDGTDDELAPEMYMFPIIDGRYMDRTVGPGPGGTDVRFDKDLDAAQPSGALLLAAMMAESSGVEREAKAVDARFMQQRDVIAYGWLVDEATQQPTGEPVRRRLRIPVLVDGFGEPLRYVHPGFQGGYGNYYNNATPPTTVVREHLKLGVRSSGSHPIISRFTRSYRPFGPDAQGNPVGDSDEGSAVGGHGYFYSPGADGDPGTRIDNVYVTVPQFPGETTKLN